MLQNDTGRLGQLEMQKQKQGNHHDHLLLMTHPFHTKIGHFDPSVIRIWLLSFCQLIIYFFHFYLQMKVTGNNLTNVCMVVYRVAKAEKNDEIFMEEDMLSRFIYSVFEYGPPPAFMSI